MAHMYPQTVPVPDDPRNTAEPLMYELLRDQLPDEYHVFHSVAWQQREVWSGARYGEADFIVAHPNLGMLVLEAKSGTITYDKPNGKWFQGRRQMEKDPVEQAKRSKGTLIQVLEDDSRWIKKWFHIAHGVAFPDSHAADLGLHAPRVQIFGQQDRRHARQWIESLFEYTRGDRRWDTLDAWHLQYLINLLAPTVTLKPMMQPAFEEEKARLVELTEEQFRFIDFISRTRRAAIAGCAGSGKTMLACHKATRLAQQGMRVLLTCYNANLAAWLREDYLAERPTSLDIVHFHKLAADLVRRTGRQLHQAGRDADDFFNHVMPEAMDEALAALGPQYDAIVVDEAQDFRENWWLPLQLLLEDPDEGILYLFYDDNQNIYGGLRQLKNVVTQEYPLTINCRNTQRINDLVTRFYDGDATIEARGPQGRDVVFIAYDSERAMLRELGRVLHELVVEQEVDGADIVILTPRGANRSALQHGAPVGRFRLSADWEIGQNEITFLTIHSFKGLESPVVILAEIDEAMHHKVRELLYIGCSRARNHLVVLHERPMGPVARGEVREGIGKLP